MDELYDDHENVLPRKHARLRILLPCFDTWGCVCLESVLPRGSNIQWTNVFWPSTKSCFWETRDSLLANLGRCLAQIFPKLLGTLGYFHPTFSTFSFHDHILIAVHCLPTFARSLLYYLCIFTLILWHLCLFILMLSLEGRILPGFTDSKR